MKKTKIHLFLSILIVSYPVFRFSTLAQPLNSNCYQLKSSLNAYSFHTPLSEGEMDLFDLIDYCAEQKFDAVDITGYYFPGYPDIPSDEYIYAVKNHAFKRGVEISGTGIRTDFTIPDSRKRKENIELVNKWTDVAAKLGAPVLRIFAGHEVPPEYSNKEIMKWMIPDIKECVNIGKEKGIIIGMQNHNGFIKNADRIIEICRIIDSDWFGIVLDIGSYRQGDPYDQITRSIPYAVNWQLKEKMYENGKEVNTDIKKVIDIIRENCYTGYIPIETLGPGDPQKKVRIMKKRLDFVLN
ncbi:sugar phosphate isomerase/epimerase family protein [Membranihabitans maritimus]|uniref:sugar phosphate isomerase/epimerase family protein n=1 Tax=Membranihabitans maritimus TaxID=2904244 RepID=UPI001F30EFC2|nr:sugar phosphate isomerase/epimerase family protein [Membranihabitans maritimus]